MSALEKTVTGPWGVARRLRGPGGRQGSFGVNVLLLGVGAILIVSGVRNRPILDVVTGKDLGEINYEDMRIGLEGETLGEVLADAKPVTNLPPGRYRGTTNIDGKPVANWIAEEILWARQHGWKGRVTSGMRSRSEQMAAATGFGLSRYANGPLGSNHYIGNGTEYPHGAVDVTQYKELDNILKRKPNRRLRWYGPGDVVHFSATGR